MKKIFKCALALILGITATTGASAQNPQLQSMPIDSAVVTGQLPNGLTYYIRHNETPKGQADFFIAQKVGSILEEDNQRGLAHFLEHMCFNGTENFPEKGIINWLESIGVKFDYNLNAYTSVDETVYNISNVPVTRQSVQDSCLLILHDWACALTLDPAEIDAERGVIHEEWRRSMVGQMRILEQLLPKVYPNNKYGVRLPIGTMDVVDNFPHQAIIDYYHTWYRPDNQAIIVVGDIDPAYIENKIKEMFSPIKMPENPRERYYVPVEDTEGTIVAIGKDTEMSAPIAMMMFKYDQMVPREIRNTQAYYAVNFITDMIQSMLNSRLSDIANKPDAPFAMASVELDKFFLASTKDALSLQVVAKGNDLNEALQAAYREILRALRGGFTVGEYERACAELRSRYQRLYDQRNNTENTSFCREYVRAYVDNEPIPGIAVDKQIYDMLSSQLPVQAVNQMLPELISDNNRVVLMLLPDNANFTVPTEAQVLDGLKAIDGEEIEAYKDEVRTDPLIPNLPAAGKIVGERHLDNWDATELTLSNGVKVIVKPTQFKENDIQFAAAAKGGYSVFPESYANSIQFLQYSLSNHGLGDYSNSDLTKYLQGKQVSLNVNFTKYDRSITGATTIQDLPTMMELIYANFAEFSYKADEFTAIQNALTGALANQEATPQFAFNKLIMSSIYKAPALQFITTDAIAKASREQTVEIAKAMLANATDFTFTFVGNIDMDVFRPLAEQYLATLPTGKSVEYKPNADFEAATGHNTVTSSTTMSTPQTWAFYLINGTEKYTPKQRAMTSMVAQIMSTRLLNKVREEMGATYSIGAGAQMNRVGNINTLLQIAFPMKPELKDEVFAAIEVIIKEMAQNVTAEELTPVREYMVKESIASLDENDAWAGGIAYTAINGVDVFTGAADVINSVTVDDLMKFWQSVLDQNNYQLIILNPAE